MKRFPDYYGVRSTALFLSALLTMPLLQDVGNGRQERLRR